MNVLIIEDESFAADKLEHMLKEIDPSINVLAKLGSIKESAKWLFNNTADLIFLDIQLSDGIRTVIPIVFSIHSVPELEALTDRKVNSKCVNRILWISW